MMATLFALASSRAASAQAPPSSAPSSAPSSGLLAYDRDADARDGVVLPDGVRSVRVLRSGEVLRARPDGNGARRGAAARDARLPALEAALGDGCAAHWVRVARAAWICTEAARLTTEPPTTHAWPLASADELVPYDYAFAAFSGARTYRRLEDVAADDWAEELERGMAVAIDRTERHEGQLFVHTASGRWLAAGDVHWAHPSGFAGATYAPGDRVDSVGFVMRATFAWPTPEQALRPRGMRDAQTVPARSAVHVRETVTLHGRPVVRTDAGWLAARALRVIDPHDPPADLRPDERWVDIDLHRQILVAFEGTRPVYGTLVSSGASAHPTGRGEFRVWIKLATTDMSNADDDSLDTSTRVYSVERVPWVMFFHDDQALHGAYWHDRFGVVHSHGCVNLAPRDARWLFAWAPPVMPPGWEAVFPNDEEPGLRVRVR